MKDGTPGRRPEAGDDPPPVDRRVPLRCLIFSHRDVFNATVERAFTAILKDYVGAQELVEGGFNADFERRFILFDNSLDDGFSVTEHGFHRITRRMVPEEARPGKEVERRFQHADPYYRATWRPFAVALGTFCRLVSQGEITIWGRWDSLSNPLQRLSTDLWPQFGLLECIDFENNTIAFPNGEKLFNVFSECHSPMDNTAPADTQTTTADSRPAISATPGAGAIEAENKPARRTARPRGRPYHADKPAIVQRGLDILKERGLWSSDQKNWSQQKDLENELDEFARGLADAGEPVSLHTIRKWIPKIIEQYQKGA